MTGKPPRLRRQRSQLEQRAHHSLARRVAVILPLLAMALSFTFSQSSFIGHVYMRAFLACLSVVTLVAVSYASWYRRAIAPRKGHGVSGEESDSDNGDRLGEEFGDEEPTPTQGGTASGDSDAESPNPEPFTAPPVLKSTTSLPASLDAIREPLDDSDHLEDMERLSQFWHPTDTAKSPKHATSDQVRTSANMLALKSSPTLPEPLYFLASTKFISSLSRDEFRSLYTQIEWLTLKPHQLLYQHGGDTVDGMFIIIEGSVDMANDSGVHVCSHTAGELIGEEACQSLMPDERRWLTCRAGHHGAKLIQMSLSLLEQWTREKPEMIISFVRTSLARQWRQASFVLRQFFKIPLSHSHSPSQSQPAKDDIHKYSVPGLNKLFADNRDDPTVQKFLDSLYDDRKRSLTAGATLFVEGSHTHQNSLFLVRAGELQATRRDSAEALVHGVGCVLDALSFLCDTPHHYTVTAIMECELTWLSPEHFSAPLAHPILFDLVRVVVSELQPTIREFNVLGLKREWKKAGQILFRQGSSATDMFVISSGRVRVINEKSLRKGDERKKQAANVTAGGKRATGPPQTTPEQNDSSIESSNTAGSEDTDPASGSALDDNNNGGDDYETFEQINGPVMYGRYDRTRRTHASVRLELGRLDCVGETSFLQSHSNIVRHSTTAICVRDSEVIRISRESFKCLIQAHPSAVAVLASIVSARLAKSMSAAKHDDSDDQHITQRVKCVCIALVPLPHAPIDFFASQLSQSLSQHGSVLLLKPALVDSILGADTTSNLSNYYHRSRFTVWLTEQEESHSFLLFQASSQLDAWTSMCVRSADYALIVAHSKNSPITVQSAEQRLIWDQFGRQSTGQDKSRKKPNISFCINDLILLHDSDTTLPTGTRFWFRSRPHLHTYHHLRIDLSSHFDRLARYLCNKTVGLVLGGGGARGLSHLGVVQAITELKVCCDFVGGTSQGALMAGIYAQLAVQHASTLSFMVDKAHEMATQVGSLPILLSDATYPMMAYFSGRVFSDAIKAILGAEIRIEDLWIKYFCVSVNVSKVDIVVHTSGSLWRAARASMSILEYLPPMQLSPNCTDLLIDGGYVDNLPVDVMRELYSPTCVIAVDVERSGDDGLKKLSYFGDALSGWWMLAKKLETLLPAVLRRGKPVKLPRYADIISSLIYIQHSRNLRQFMQAGIMDVYIKPKLGEAIQLLDYAKEPQIVELGYKAAKVALTEWKLKNPNFASAVNDIDDEAPASTIPAPAVMSRSMTSALPSIVSDSSPPVAGRAAKTKPSAPRGFVRASSSKDLASSPHHGETGSRKSS